MSLDHLLGSISPQSPYYKDDENDNPKVKCLYCYRDIDIDIILIIDGEKVCQECNEYNKQINENQ